MLLVSEEKYLYDYDFVVAGGYQKSHFFGFFPMLFHSLESLNMIGYEKNLSDDFLSNYRGNIIVMTKLRTDKLSARERSYKTIMITHGPLPVSRRSWQKPRCDYMISNGTPELAKRLDHKHVGKLITDGYFPTDFFLPDRSNKKALVQVTEPQHSPLQIAEVCRMLLDRGYQTLVYNHVIFKTNLSEVPSEVQFVKPGLDYVRALSTCSHFVFCGTSGFITCMYTQGCRMICLGENWARKNKKEFSDILLKSCHVVQTETEFIDALDQPSKYGQEMTEYLFGRDRGSVIDKIQKSLSAIARGEL